MKIDPSLVIRHFKIGYHEDPARYTLQAVTPLRAPIRLRPIQAGAQQISMSDVNRLTEWRNLYRTSFLSEFTATPERTLRWLTDICGPDSTRILFMVEDAEGAAFGHVGLCNVDGATWSGEVDNIVRGREGVAGGMETALRALLAWARGELGLTQVSVRVMADNPAVRFYERIGFRTVKDVPLRRQQVGPAEFRWHEQPDGEDQGERALRYMELAA